MAAAAAALFLWNLILTIRFEDLRHSIGTEQDVLVGDDSSVIEQTVEGYTTDITETAETVMPALVCISVLNESSEHIISGVVYASIGADTWILTASRWISEDAEYIVRFDSGLSCTGELYGMDPLTDIALIRTHPEFETESIRLGASNALKQGEYVIAMGGRNLHTQAGEVSFGVVSKPGQYYVSSSADNAEWITEGILTDISLSDNLSGGPIVNLSGQMIVILSPALADGRSSAVAVGINEAVLIAEQIRNNQELSRGYIGIVGQDVKNLELYQKSAMNIPLDINSGVVIAEVADGSPAQEAGLQPNDVITEIGDNALNGVDALRRQQYTRSPGETLELTVVRGGNTLSVTVLLR